MKGRTELCGRRYIGLIRCSTTQQSDTSIPDQIKVLRAFGVEHEMVHVDDVVLDGVSGSTLGARTDIAQIILRKINADDFDVLLVQDMSRFTRGGAEHGMKLEYDLNVAGIDVIFVADHLPEGDHSGIIKSVGYYAARQYAKSLSFATTRGAMSSLEQGRIAHCMRVPFGIDRLYLSADNRPLHIIRNLADGTQLKLDPTTGAVLETFAADSGRGRSNHYRMQTNERAVLVPGAPERIEAVRQMFRRRLVDGWAGFRIAKELNARGILSGRGQPWSVSSVNAILRNSVYTGIGIANRYTSAIYNIRAKNAPKPSCTDRKTLAARRKPAQSIRPKSDWMEIEYPALKDYLADLRERAVEWQRHEIGKSVGTRVGKPTSRDRHVDSPYILKGIARSNQGSHPLTGRTLGRKGNKTRYYAVHRGFTVPKFEKTLRRLIPAESLERAVIGAAEKFLAAAPDLRPRLLKMIDQQRRAAKSDTADSKKLEAERKNVAAQIELVIESLGQLGREAAKSKLQELEVRLAHVTNRLERASKASPVIDADPAAIADQIIERLAHLGQSMKSLPVPSLRAVLCTLISKLEVDLETRAVVIEFALPQGAVMCLEDRFARKSGHQAHYYFTLKLAVFHCQGVKKNHVPTCFQCRRAA